MKIHKMDIKERVDNGDIVLCIRVPDEYTKSIDSAAHGDYIPCTLHIDLKSKERSYHFYIGDIAVGFEYMDNLAFHINLYDKHKLLHIRDAFGHHYEIEEIRDLPKCA